MREDIASLRQNYTQAVLNKKSINKDPFKQFDTWFQEALDTKICEPNAMILGTSNNQNSSSLRTVLLKDIANDTFIFYTNYASRKGRDLSGNNAVSLLFPWYELERQVIIMGKAEKVSKENAEKYFHSRPKNSQIGAWVSNQSSVIQNRLTLEKKYDELEKKYNNTIIPLPDLWGGYRVYPSSIEFWQGRPNRLHDRILFERDNNNWKISRLSP